MEMNPRVRYIFSLSFSFPAQHTAAENTQVVCLRPTPQSSPKSSFPARKVLLLNEDLGPTKNVKTFFSLVN